MSTLYARFLTAAALLLTAFPFRVSASSVALSFVTILFIAAVTILAVSSLSVAFGTVFLTFPPLLVGCVVCAVLISVLSLRFA